MSFPVNLLELGKPCNLYGVIAWDGNLYVSIFFFFFLYVCRCAGVALKNGQGDQRHD